jgi:predicted HAD superfamily Cof-like phosphohydrolase
MSNNWALDIWHMQQKFGVHDTIEKIKNDPELMSKYLRFRMDMIAEEIDETNDAIAARDPEEIVDGLIDMIVFAIGTLDLLGIDADAAWDKVYEANMAKSPGVKKGRPNPFGFPDLIKPEGWKAPSHEGNHGIIANCFPST